MKTEDIKNGDIVVIKEGNFILAIGKLKKPTFEDFINSQLTFSWITTTNGVHEEDCSCFMYDLIIELIGNNDEQ